MRNMTVGHQNIAEAFQVIEEERLRINVSDAGGTKVRKFFFYAYRGTPFEASKEI